MTVAATEATNRGSHQQDSILKFSGQRCRLASASVENGTDRLTERRVRAPKFHLQTTSASIEKDGTLNLRTLTIARGCEAVSSNEQVVGALHPKHLEAYQ